MRRLPNRKRPSFLRELDSLLDSISAQLLPDCLPPTEEISRTAQYISQEIVMNSFTVTAVGNLVAGVRRTTPSRETGPC